MGVPLPWSEPIWIGESPLQLRPSKLRRKWQPKAEFFLGRFEASLPWEMLKHNGTLTDLNDLVNIMNVIDIMVNIYIYIHVEWLIFITNYPLKYPWLLVKIIVISIRISWNIGLELPGWWSKWRKSSKFDMICQLAILDGGCDFCLPTKNPKNYKNVAAM